MHTTAKRLIRSFQRRKPLFNPIGVGEVIDDGLKRPKRYWMATLPSGKLGEYG